MFLGATPQRFGRAPERLSGTARLCYTLRGKRHMKTGIERFFKNTARRSNRYDELALFDESWTRAAGRWPVDLHKDRSLRQSFDVLRKKWGEVPFDQYDRRMSADLLKLNDQEILDTWNASFTGSSTGKAFSVRGWYQTLYRDAFRGKKILDVGCGLAPDTIHFAEHGAIVTFLDVVESNVAFAERVCRIKSISTASFFYLEDLTSLDTLPNDYDVIYCCGSFINAPLEMSRIEAQALLKHLPNRRTLDRIGLSGDEMAAGGQVA